MKHIYFAALFLSCYFQIENTLSQTSGAPCGVDYWLEKSLQDPVLFQKHEEYEKGILQVFEQQKTSPDQSGMVKTIPVVVHIVHDGGAENLSDAQAQQAISWLNQALANQGYFDRGSGADCGIQLCFAQRTPDGQVTNGITRNQSPLTVMQMETQDHLVKNINRWKPKDYVNIWVVRSICSSNYGCNVYGYSNYPSSHGSNSDGIMIEAAFVTDPEKVSGLAHELGHYLGLYHTFEGGCNNNNCLTQGDRICDTPPDQSTASLPCTETFSSCATDTQSGPFSSDQPDMTQNFLDYGLLACFHDYTPDQATRMNATLDGIRKSLQESKGCLPPCPAPTVAGFTANVTTIAVGGTVNFSNTSQNAGSYQWTVNSIPFGNQANASYTFLAPGTYTIRLKAQPSNSTLCDPDDFQLTIQVYCSVTASFTLSEFAPDQDETITITNTSQNATQMEWFVNGVSQGPTLDSISFSAAGAYEIRLVTSNGTCMATAKDSVYVQGVCVQKTFDVYVHTDYEVNFTRSSITTLTDGNMLLACTGRRFVITGDQSPLLVKMKPNGQIVWAKEVGFDSTLVSVAVVRATPDGGFVAFFNENDWSVSVDSQKLFLVKYSANGMELWSQKISKVNNSFLELTALVNPDGSTIVLTPYLTKFSSTGTALWTKNYKALYQLAPYPDGGFLALESNTVLRFDEMGNLIWRRVIAASTSTQPKNLLAMPDGNIFVSGCVAGTPLALCKGLMVKLNPDGETIWAKHYRQIPVSTYRFEAMTQSANGNLTIGGYAIADNPGPGGLINYHLMLELDLDGNIVWSRHRPNGFQVNEITGLPAGGVAVVGNGLRILKTDPLGQTGGCPEVPLEILTFDLPITNTLENVVIEDTTLLITPVALPGTALNWDIDTLCTPMCQISFEICNNNLDDDGDGLFDCLDADCDCTEDQCSPQQANLWYFGHKAGLDFSTEPPTVLSDGMCSTNYISSTMSDSKGNLLFYTDGTNVYNRFHQPMPNGNIQFGGKSIIVPHPSEPGLYYLVLSSLLGGIRIYTVDMSLDDGRGDVADALLVAFTSGLAVTKACSFNGYWVLTRKPSNGTALEDFWAFKIDEDGLSNDIVYSNVGQAVDLVEHLKISPDGKRIACSYETDGKYYLSMYDFDPYNTGIVSNPRVLNINPHPLFLYGVEFSPNSRYLYASGEFADNANVVQFDLEAGDINAISNSMTVIESQANIATGGFLQLAPNGKIYVPILVFANTPFLDVIHSPNKPGTACQYQKKGVDLGPTGAVWGGLCNVISSYLNVPYIAFPNDAPDTICQLNAPIFYQIPNVQCKVDSITWITENLNTQIQPNYQYATIRYLTPGTGRLIVTAHTPCGSSSDTLEVLVVPPLNKTLDLGPDLVVCDNGVFSFNAGSGFTRYLWSDGTADSTVTTLFPGKYWVNVWDLCGNHQSDTITVSIAPNSVLDLGPDLPQQCSGTSSTYQRPANFESWRWSPEDFLSCTDCPSVTVSPTVSATWVIIGQTPEGCISVDTLRATIRDTLLFSLDTSVCVGQTLTVLGVQLPADTTAQFFLPTLGAGCDTILTVNVLGIENSASELEVTICSNAFFEYNGTMLPVDTVAIFQLASSLSCDSVVTVTVNSHPPLSLTLPMDTTIHIGASVLLEAELIGTVTLDFVWSPSEGLSCIDCLDPLASPLDTITYTLAVTDQNGCTVQESVTVRVNEECRVRIPNAFTPNGDAANDRFRPITDPCVRTVRLWKILNRWGETVFTQINFPSTDSELGWDGIWKGKPHPSDVLIWVAEFEYFDGRRESRKGEVTLVR
ncbi:MAG: M43 family zinc metalloprotease [Saprospiraceae bacterium]